MIIDYTRSAPRWNAHSSSWWIAPGRERALNWIAFGLLLAAWNFSDDDAATRRVRRPAHVENHVLVTARAARDRAY